MTAHTEGTRRAVRAGLVVGLLASALTLVVATADPRRVLLAWIAAFGFATATVLSAMILVMVLHVAGARWWLVLRRVFLATAGTVPLLVLLFVPIGAAFTIVYPWASPPPDLSPEATEALESQRTWNHGAFFLGRSAIYLAIWTILALLLRREDAEDVERDAFESRRRTLSAVGIPLLGFTMTFASFDWFMSLQPAWTSNIYGVYVFASGLVSALSVVAIGAWLTSSAGDGLRPDHFHALGRLLLMAVIFWAYIGFFQLLLVWIADLPREAGFYVARSRGVWGTVDVILVAGRFAFPFVLLLSRPLKRSPTMLAGIATWLLATSALDFAWLALPAGGAHLALSDLLPFIAVTALFGAYGAYLFGRGAGDASRSPAARAADPLLRDALRYRSP